MSNDSVKKEIKKRVDFLNEAAKAYYKENREIISNFEYDKLYDELLELEERTGIVLANSPSCNVGYETLSDLPKEAHPKRMLSLNKTKSVDELVDWLGDKDGVLSWKMDGLTVVLTFEGGKLEKAVTRGNGEIGEVITANARTFVDLPVSIPFKGHLVLRGEAFILYSDFERINESIPEMGAKYKNPRNLCSGSVRQLSSAVTAQRSVHFYAFSLAEIEGTAGPLDTPQLDTRIEQMEWLAAQGFDTVAYVKVSAKTLRDEIKKFEEQIPLNDIPSDGLVLIYDDIAYGQSLGETAKFPRDGIAFKWSDELAQTTLKQIEWSASRTGLINPIAIFEPVELEGTTVSRASIHNVSIMKELKLGIGDQILVYKANMIIPQIAENLSQSSTCAVPESCPVCGAKAEVKKSADVEVLYCTNSDCPAKKIKAFELFASRDAMNIEGMSESTIEKFVAEGFIKEFGDFFNLASFKQEIIMLEGFGEKSYDNIIASTRKASTTTASRLLFALGIAGIGSSNAKLIAKHCKNDWSKMQSIDEEELLTINGVGTVMARAYVDWFANQENISKLNRVLKYIQFEQTAELAEQIFEGKTFVITGSLEHYENRNALKAEIESLGGKVAASVSANTDYLINNDIHSTSSKNKKAIAEGVPIISEEDYMKLAGK